MVAIVVVVIVAVVGLADICCCHFVFWCVMLRPRPSTLRYQILIYSIESLGRVAGPGAGAVGLIGCVGGIL